MANKYNRTSISGLFESKFGFSVKVTPELIDKLSEIKEGGWLQVSKVKDETRERIAQERGKDVEQTIAAYLEFSVPSDESAEAEEAPAPKKKAARVEKF